MITQLFAFLVAVFEMSGVIPHPVCEVAVKRPELSMVSEADRMSRLVVCSAITHRAAYRGLPELVALELAWTESGWTMSAENPRTKCWGPLQVVPYFWCPNRTRKGCDPIEAGLDALATMLRMFPNQEQALCHYKSGNVCTTEGHRAAREVLRRVRRLQMQLDQLEKERSLAGQPLAVGDTGKDNTL